MSLGFFTHPPVEKSILNTPVRALTIPPSGSNLDSPLQRNPPAARLVSQEERRRPSGWKRTEKAFGLEADGEGRETGNGRRRSTDRMLMKKVARLETEGEDRQIGIGRQRSKDWRRSESEFTGRPTRLKVKRADINGQRPGGTGRVTRTGFCQKKRSYHKGDSIGKRDSLR